MGELAPYSLGLAILVGDTMPATLLILPKDLLPSCGEAGKDGALEEVAGALATEEGADTCAAPRPPLFELIAKTELSADAQLPDEPPDIR